MVMVTVVMLPRFSLATETGSMGTNMGAVGFPQEDDPRGTGIRYLVEGVGETRFPPPVLPAAVCVEWTSSSPLFYSL